MQLALQSPTSAHSLSLSLSSRLLRIKQPQRVRALFLFPDMATRRPVALLLALVVCSLAASAGATQFRVGGDKGWSVPDAGSEPYNTWAGRLRFQIGDQLLFVYPKETDSVLLVDAAAYNACNTSSYVSRYDDGSTVFTFHRSGPFFFVSGNETSCRANEKLIVVVLADRSGTRTPPPSSAPLPSPPSPPPAAAPATSPPPSASPPSSGATAPVPAPAATPTSPAASAPAPAPTTTIPSSPPAPTAQTPSPSTTPTPGGGSSSSSPPSASASAPGGEGGSSSTTPPPPSAAAPVVAGLVGSLGAFIGYAMLAA